MPALRIVHISDLHMRADWSTDQTRVLDAFLRDFEQRHAERQVDLVVFTGDLAFSGKEDQYVSAQTKLLDPLEKKYGLSRERIVLVPGNHDIDLDLIPQFVETGLAAQLTTRDAVNTLMLEDRQLDLATDRLKTWRSFRKQFYGEADVERCNGLSALHNLEISSVKVSVAVLSSPWRATGASDDADRGRLIVGERQTAETVSKMDADAIRIVAMHHPVDWLTDFDRADTVREFARTAEIVLTGHVHLGDSIHITSRQGNYIQSAAGSLYSQRAFLNSYSILDYSTETDSLDIIFRTYYDDRDDFGTGENLIAGGRMSFVLKHISPEVVRTSEAASLTRVRLRTVIRENLVSTGIAELADELLIEPVFLPLPLEQYISTTDPETGERIALPDLGEDIVSGDVIILAGEESAGLTCALAWLLTMASEADPTASPALLDFKALGTTRDPVDRSLRSWLNESDFAIHPSKATDELPRIAVAVDNFDPSPRDKRANRVVAHLATAKEPVRIVGCRPHEVSEVEGLVRAAGMTSRKRYLGRFGRKHIRELSIRLDQAEPDKLAQAAFALFDRERIPRTPFMIIVVLEILVASNYSSVGGSETDILSMHADRLLGRSEVAEDQRFDFDYRNRQHLISRLAFDMLQRPNGQISRLDAEEFILGYLRVRDQNLRVSEVLDIYVNRKVLWERNGVLGFRQPAMLNFFAASAATEDDGLREILRGDPLRFATAFRHAAMLRRDDKDLLQTTLDLLSRALEGRTQPGSYFARENPKDARHTFDDGDFARRVVETAEAQAKGSPLAPVDDPNFDQLLDALDQRAELYAGEELSTREGAFGLLQIVSFCAAVLRSSELVDDSILRSRALRLVISGYAITAQEISEHDVMQAAEEFVSALLNVIADNDQDVITRAIGLFRRQFPAIMSGMEMSNWLSSPKLSASVKNCVIDDEFMAQPGNALMTAMLAMECNVEGRLEILDSILDLYPDVPAVVCAVQFIAFAMNQITRMDDPQRSALEGLAVRASTCGIAYDSPAEQVRHREDILENIRRERLARAFKAKTSPGLSVGEPGAPAGPWYVTERE